MDVLDYVNRARAARGEPPLVVAPSIREALTRADLELVDRIADETIRPASGLPPTEPRRQRSRPKKKETEMPFERQAWKRENLLLRMLLTGPTGAGKTLGALRVATTLFGGALKVGLLDTEHGRGKIYADQFGLHDYVMLHSNFDPGEYLDAMKSMVSVGCDLIVVDSASHEWIGSGGILSQADRFGDWKTVRPKHNAFVEGILSLPVHVVLTVRAKMKYEVEEVEDGNRKKQVIRKLGVGPVQSDDILYEFDIVGFIDSDSHDCTFSNRCTPLVDTTRQLDADVAVIITDWLSEGEPPEPPPAADPAEVAKLVALLDEEGLSGDVIEKAFTAARSQNRGELHPDFVAEKIAAATERKALRETPQDAPSGPETRAEGPPDPAPTPEPVAP